jgi:hypothetical protein
MAAMAAAAGVLKVPGEQRGAAQVEAGAGGPGVRSCGGGAHMHARLAA